MPGSWAGTPDLKTAWGSGPREQAVRRGEKSMSSGLGGLERAVSRFSKAGPGSALKMRSPSLRTQRFLVGYSMVGSRSLHV